MPVISRDFSGIIIIYMTMIQGLRVIYMCHKLLPIYLMMTSSNGNIFRVTGPLCGNSPVSGEFPSQRPVTRSFDVFFDLNEQLSKQP